MFLTITSPSSKCSSYSWNEWIVGHFCFHNQNNSTSSPGSLTCRRLHFWRHFLIKHKILPNLIISNWLWWIKRVLLANQNRGNILNERIIFFLNITLVLDSLDTLQTCSVLIFLRVPQPCKSVVVINCTTLLIQLFISIYLWWILTTCSVLWERIRKHIVYWQVSSSPV